MKPSTTSDKLKQEIDQGRGGDKVPFPDPAAAPLGTDAEAGGRPPQPSEIEAAEAGELHAPPRPGPSASEERTRSMSGTMRHPVGIGVGIAVAAAVVVLVLVVASVL